MRGWQQHDAMAYLCLQHSTQFTIENANHCTLVINYHNSFRNIPKQQVALLVKYCINLKGIYFCNLAFSLIMIMAIMLFLLKERALHMLNLISQCCTLLSAQKRAYYDVTNSPETWNMNENWNISISCTSKVAFIVSIVIYSKFISKWITMKLFAYIK